MGMTCCSAEIFSSSGAVNAENRLVRGREGCGRTNASVATWVERRGILAGPPPGAPFTFPSCGGLRRVTSRK
jgi:hypothetical protein